jgi:hypothetical protein
MGVECLTDLLGGLTDAVRKAAYRTKGCLCKVRKGAGNSATKGSCSLVTQDKLRVMKTRQVPAKVFLQNFAYGCTQLSLPRYRRNVTCAPKASGGSCS